MVRLMGLAALTVALAIPGSVLAAGHGGGGHGGGGHGGGHGGGFSRGGFGRGFGGFGGFGYGYGLGYAPYYSYGYSYPYNSYYTGPYVYPSTTYNYAPQINTVPSVAVQPAEVPNGIAPVGYSTSSTAQIEVHVPAKAEIWVDGNKTTQTGTTRLYESPPLKAGSRYVYEIKAKWMENGHKVEQKREVAVQPGQRSTADFLQPQQPAATGVTLGSK